MCLLALSAVKTLGVKNGALDFSVEKAQKQAAVAATPESDHARKALFCIHPSDDHLVELKFAVSDTASPGSFDNRRFGVPDASSSSDDSAVPVLDPVTTVCTTGSFGSLICKITNCYGFFR